MLVAPSPSESLLSINASAATVSSWLPASWIALSRSFPYAFLAPPSFEVWQVMHFALKSAESRAGW